MEANMNNNLFSKLLVGGLLGVFVSYALVCNFHSNVHAEEDESASAPIQSRGTTSESTQ